MNENEGDSHESFRDSISTINDEGKRSWIYAQKPVGSLYNKRTLLSFVYLIVFFCLPFVKVAGEPLFLVNITERKFILFGAIFWPQDLFLFVIGMLTFIVFIVYCRIWSSFLWMGLPSNYFHGNDFQKIRVLD